MSKKQKQKITETGGSDLTGSLAGAVNIKFWDVPPCRSCENQRFGGMCRLHLQAEKVREQEQAS
jgi:hypothetical protein